MPWLIYVAFTMHATVSNYHFFRSCTFLDNLKLLIDSFSQIVELLFLRDVTDTFFRKNLAPPPYCMPLQCCKALKWQLCQQTYRHMF